MNNQPKINIIFRSCDLVNAVNKAPRPFNLNKKTLIKICFKSLYNNLPNINCKIIVLGDNLSTEMREFFLGHNIKLLEGVYGNDDSIRETIKIALDLNDDEWVYFCEDDYLHTPSFFDKISTLIREKESITPGKIKLKKLLRKRYLTLMSFKRYINKPELVIFPCDYPDRYLNNSLEKSFIFKTSNHHWRQVSSTTFTFLMKVSELKKYKKNLLKSAFRANDHYLSKVLYGKSFFFNKMLCVSPIPSLSCHMHTETMSPLQDWEKIVNQLKSQI